MFTRLTSSVQALICLLGLLCLTLTSAQASETVLHSFSNNCMTGANPVGQLVAYGGAFYGVTWKGINGYGDIFRMSSSGVITVLHEFNGTDGFTPTDGMTLVNGILYGITYQGGANMGVLFRIAPNGSAFAVLHSFTGASDGLGPLGTLLLASDGNLYGATYEGGSSNQGTAFSYNPMNGSYSIIHNFNSNTDTVSHPKAGFAEGNDGYLYSTTLDASGYSSGLYRLKKDGTGYAFVHGFSSSDPAGQFAFCDLMKASDGNIYGVSRLGGANGLGTVYKLVPSTGSVTPLWSFDGYTGEDANSKQIQGTDGNLYGVASSGGYYGYGTIFKLSLSGACSVLTDFDYWNAGLSGANSLVQYGTKFYCTSFDGGQFALPDNSFIGYGAAMSISAAGAMKVLNSFYQREGWNAYAPLVQSGSSFYGETYYGGEYGYGLIYKTDASGHFTVLHHFNDQQGYWEGAGPDGGPLLARDGSLYGLTSPGEDLGQGPSLR